MVYMARHHGIFEKLRQPGAHSSDAFMFYKLQIVFFTDVAGEVVQRQSFTKLSDGCSIDFTFGATFFAFALRVGSACGSFFAVGIAAVHDELPVPHAHSRDFGRLHAQNGVMR